MNRALILDLDEELVMHDEDEQHSRCERIHRLECDEEWRRNREKLEIKVTVKGGRECVVSALMNDASANLTNLFILITNPRITFTDRICYRIGLWAELRGDHVGSTLRHGPGAALRWWTALGSRWNVALTWSRAAHHVELTLERGLNAVLGCSPRWAQVMTWW
ncbi:hypothetical protein PIB30_030821 [Stylosanthes scabra]|uniref:Uncharacterized protein n=1 Tax=Stylosanthes scabra TaxID=79078 RepID=A0ABU6SBE4_9FABA|nr:hypothetical protein [Stylosanthes scabra]